MSKLIKSFMFVVVGLFVMSSTPAQAKSDCSGQSQSACEGAGSCSWVEAFDRKDGAKVKAHCRAKPQAGQSKKSDDVKAKKEKVEKKVEKKEKKVEKDSPKVKKEMKEKKETKEKKEKKAAQ
jgi:hypothetical protein